MFTKKVLISVFCVGLSLLAEGQESRSDSPDFLFSTPKGYLGIQGGWAFASASSDIFTHVTEILTVDKGDFSSPVFYIEFAKDLNPRLTVAFQFGYSKASIDSEFEDWVDQDDNPIEQTTEYIRIPLTVNAKFYLSPRGREISRYAWIPHSVAPYVGGGGGFLWYRFEQYGDFVDFDDLDIFSDKFTSGGWTPTLHVFGGVEIKLQSRLFLGLEARYTWAESNLTQDFVGFDPIDLAGFSTTVGINILF